ncbi:MAG: hypothetical protein HKN84_05960 [Gammaproteobacteria bacterium]|nr:hypothetical protein [Gammaproteobacteria bacterium]
MKHWFERVTAIALAWSLSACTSLPGFEPPGEDSASQWFGETDDGVESADGYDFEVHRISPALLADLDSSIETAYLRYGGLPEPPSSGDYAIGPGDVLGIIVYGHPDITNPAALTETLESSGRVVDSRGQIFVPFSGTLQVAGLTAREVRDLVTSELSRVISDPQVDVRVLQFRSQKIFVTGDLERPCTIPVTDSPINVIEALTVCQSRVTGPSTEISNVNSILLLREGRTYVINLSLLYRSGGGPIQLQHGDRLIVDNRLNKVFVIGEFARQTTVDLAAGSSTLADAIAAAGGLDLNTADPGAIFVIRAALPTEPVDTVAADPGIRASAYHLDASSVEAMILADQFQLQPRDIVFAAPAGLVNFNRALALITPSIDALFRTYILSDRVNN